VAAGGKSWENVAEYAEEQVVLDTDSKLDRREKEISDAVGRKIDNLTLELSKRL